VVVEVWVWALLLDAPVATTGAATVAAVAVRAWVVGEDELTVMGIVVTVALAPSVAR
jgi:hypothetical protein